MRRGLLDFIFLNLEEKHLNRKQVVDYLLYLKEIITPNMSAPDRAKYQALQVKLNNWLVQLDKETPNRKA
jgi:hypothetical protein